MRGLSVMSLHSISKQAVVATLTGSIFLSAHAFAESAVDAISTQVRTVFEKTRDAIVRVEASDEHGRIAGTGFFIDPNGTLFTCYAVGGESTGITVSHGPVKYPATRLIADSRSGIAILKVDARTPFLRLGKSTDLGLAEMVTTIGYPMDLPITPSVGTVAGFDVKYLGRCFATGHIRANVPAQRGEGGAPLLNMNGEVVGMLISSLDHGAGCFALPIEAAEKVHGDYMVYGELRPGWMGIKVGEAEKQAEGSVAEVLGFVPGAPAQESALLPGDVLTQIGARKVRSPEDVLSAAFFLTAGDEVPVCVVRAGKAVEVKLRAGEHPSTPQKTAHAPPGGLSFSLLRVDQ